MFQLRSPGSKASRSVVVGDGGTRGGDTTWARIAGQVAKGYYDAVVSLGDFSYSNGFASIYNEFFRRMQGYNITTSIPTLVTPGNHENIYNFDAYLDRSCSCQAR
eukprot:SRR837773.17332.p2 GENE.SRR837773.17332~~SRR837773.17332.p2  ORF type:complete len:105 (+),score=21.21 SRR837773.17332:97-411(+)